MLQRIWAIFCSQLIPIRVGSSSRKAPTQRESARSKSILAIANGYIGTRASIAEEGRFSHPSTFAAGIYVTDTGLELGPRLAVLPNLLRVEVAVEDRQLSLEAARTRASPTTRLASGRAVARVAAAGPEWAHHPIDLSPARFPRRPARTPPVGNGNGRETTAGRISLTIHILLLPTSPARTRH